VEVDAKDDYWATFADAKKILRRFRTTAKPLGYCTAIFGSTVLNGAGHDIDVQMAGTDSQSIEPGPLAMRLVKKHAKRLLMYEEKELGDCQDVWVIFVTHDNHYIDLHIKGATE